MNNLIKWIVGGCITAASIVTLSAWQQSPGQVTPAPSKHSDTIPGKRDLDRELKEIAAARQQVELSLQQDFSGMQQQLKESIAALDDNKIRMQAEKALQQVNIEESLKAAELAVNNIDFDNLLKELDSEKRLSEKDREKARKDIEKAKKELKKELANKDWNKEMRAVDWTKVEKEMQDARRELEAAKLEIADNADRIPQELGKAVKELDEAETELRGYQEMIYQMESAGSLNTHKDYSIKWEDPNLQINGNTQPKSVTSSYRKFFKEKYTLITKQDGKINIRKGSENK